MSRKILETVIDGHCINIGVVEMESEQPINLRINRVPKSGEMKLVVRTLINNTEQYQEIGTFIRG